MARKPTTTTKNEDENKALATQQQGGALTMGAMPDFMKGQAQAGMEAADASDTEIPRVQLLQSVSPEVEDFDAAKAGIFWHNMAELPLGNEIEVIPVLLEKRATLWRPRPEGGILARSTDLIHWTPANARFEVKLKGRKDVVVWETKDTIARSGLMEWGSSNPDDPNSPPAGVLSYNFLMLFPEHLDLGPAVVTLQRSSARVARKLIGKLKMVNAPSFGIKLVMSAVKEEGPEGPFYNFAFRTDGFVQDLALFNQAKDLYEAVSATGLKVKDLQDDEPVGEGADAEETGKGKY